MGTTARRCREGCEVLTERQPHQPTLLRAGRGSTMSMMVSSARRGYRCAPWAHRSSSLAYHEATRRQGQTDAADLRFVALLCHLRSYVLRSSRTLVQSNAYRLACSRAFRHYITMSERKAVIKNADMSDDMQTDAIDCAVSVRPSANGAAASASIPQLKMLAAHGLSSRSQDMNQPVVADCRRWRSTTSRRTLQHT
jgi:hypothetical protein